MHCSKMAARVIGSDLREVSSLVGRKIEVKDRADSVYLVTRVRAGVVYMFVVAVELDVPGGEREKAPCCDEAFEL